MRRAIVICALLGACGGGLEFDENGCPLMDGHSARVEWAPSTAVPAPPKSLRFTAVPTGVGGQGYVVKDDASREGRGLIDGACTLQLDLPSSKAGVSAAWLRGHWTGTANPGQHPVSLYPE